VGAVSSPSPRPPRLEAGAQPVFESLFQDDLVRGERIVWTGKPDERRLFSAADRFLIPFSLLWLAFTVLWLLDALGALPIGLVPDQGTFVVFGTVFLVMALYAAVGRFIFKRWMNAHTYYALTNRRALIVQQARRRNLAVFPLDQLTSIETSVQADGVGTVFLGQTTVFDAIYGNTGLSFLKSGVYTPAFYDISDAKGVAAQIDELRRQQPKRKR